MVFVHSPFGTQLWHVLETCSLALPFFNLSMLRTFCVTRNLSKHFKAILRCFFFQRSRPMSLGLHGHQVSQVSPAPATNENQASAIRASILVRHFRMCVLLRTIADFKPVMKRNYTILPIGPGGQSMSTYRWKGPHLAVWQTWQLNLGARSQELQG